MSHQNQNRGFQPYFDFPPEQYNYNGSIPQLNVDTTQQWGPTPRPRSTQPIRNSVPSPSFSAHTTRNTQNIRSSDRMQYYGTNLSPTGHGTRPETLDELSLTPECLPRGFDAIERPWSLYNMRGPDTSSFRSPFAQTSGSYRQFRGPGSDNHVSPSDEGYCSQMAHSTFSNEPICTNQEVPSIVLKQIDDMNVQAAASEAPSMSRRPSDQRSQLSGRSGKSNKSIQCSVPNCEEVSKCNSDHKKHMLKHDKPFKCDVLHCKRAEQGFTTTNDLDRHKKSVHSIGLTKKSYQCAAEHCRNKDKVWPRLDNFKQHVERMHKDEDPLDLIKKSEFQPKASTHSPDDELTVAPMDTSHVVAGMEKSFSANPTMDSMSLIDLSLEQDRRWSSFGPGLDDFPRNAYPMTQQASGPTSAPNNLHFQGPPRPSSKRQPAPGISVQQAPTSNPTRIPAPVVREPNAPKITKSKADPPLPNGPQTKAQQQRSALHKLSQAVTSSISGPKDSVDLESLILNILNKATDSAKWEGDAAQQAQSDTADPVSSKVVTLTKSEAIQATQMMMNLIKGSPGSAYTVQRRSNKGFLPNAKVCQHCGYAVARDCDLRKHMKRHQKAYGCTYPKCHKRFGAKSDWKRHENSQHFQLEAFRCAQKSSTGSTCGEHIHRQEAFKSHLEEQHKISSPEHIQEYLKCNKIGKNCQGSFWCGFCEVVVQLKNRRNAAWDERFDHIAQHFEKDKKSIDEWVCAEENRTKKELLKEMDRYVYDDDDERERDGDVDAAGEADDDVHVPGPPPFLPENMPMPRNTAPPPPPEAMAQGKGKRTFSETNLQASYEPTKARRTTTMNRYCCGCGDPLGAVDVECLHCGHQMCTRCPAEEANISPFDVFLPGRD